jgi:Mn2+/Fe2+ NRAMP family transporter
MGPGLILSAAIVGSGELIATTTLGAKAGFGLLWVILLGCTVKVAVQMEYGRFCIAHGQTTFQGWNRVGASGRRMVHWTIYVGALYMLANMAGQAGVLGGASQVMRYAVPGSPLLLWVLANIIIVGLLLSQGRYKPVELVATGLNLVFVLAVLYCVVAVQWTASRYSAADLAGGFSLRLPPDTLSLAIAAFGITGVAAGEIAMYPYWCLEKGYARWTGPNDGSVEWQARARGWSRVMGVDSVVSMLVYTLATCGFYILGATVLRSQDVLADGNALILQLSSMFTDVLGGPARVIFMACAFTVLFSTLFANAAGFSRLWTDFFGLHGLLDWHDARRRSRCIAIVAWAFAASCGVIYGFIQKPLLLVTFMGICNALFLIVVAYQAVLFRYRHTEPALKPGRFYDLAFWISLAAIATMAIRAAVSLVKG